MSLDSVLVCTLTKIQYGGIDMSAMQTLEGLGIQDKNRIYGEAVDNLKRLKMAMDFSTRDHNTYVGCRLYYA